VFLLIGVHKPSGLT